jgi:uncharacterized protein
MITARLLSLVKILLSMCTAFYLAMCVALYVKQREMLFDGSHDRAPFESLGLQGARQVSLETPDGATLVGFLRKADAGKPTIIFFHGKGGEISRVAPQLAYYGERGFGYVGFSHRGFGDSSGEPTEARLIADAVFIYDWTVKQGVSPSDIVVLGSSLGTGIAVQLAAQRPAAALGLAAPYTSAADVAAERYWYMPVNWLMLDPLRSIDHIAKINAPLIIVHGERDMTVPFHFGRALFERAVEPKVFVPYTDEGHAMINTPLAWEQFAAFFGKISRK